MAVRVELTDATIELGGSFEEAKSRAKGWGGKWMPETKTWKVGKTLKETQFCNFPMTIVSGKDDSPRYASGNHITRYGNAYSQSEWQAYQATLKNEREVEHEFTPRFEALKAQVAVRLAEIFDSQTAAKVAAIIVKGDLSDLVAAGAIKFSSQEKRDAVFAIDGWHSDAWTALHREMDEAKG